MDKLSDVKRQSTGTGLYLWSRSPNAEVIDETLETVQCSFSSTEEPDNLKPSLEEDEEGFETTLDGNKFWVVKGISNAISGSPQVNTMMSPNSNEENSSVKAVLRGGNDKQGPDNVSTPFDAVKRDLGVSPVQRVDRKYVEVVLRTIEDEDRPKNQRLGSEESQSNVGVGMLPNYLDKEEAQLILLDLHGAEAAMMVKKVRFDLEGEDDPGKSTVGQCLQRKKLLHLLRAKGKSKNGKTSVGCPPLVQMAIQTEPITNAPTCPMKDFVPGVDGANERDDYQTNTFSDLIIELYNAFLKTVVESYVLCQHAGEDIEERALNYADNEFLRNFFGEIEAPVDVFGNEEKNP